MTYEVEDEVDWSDGTLDEPSSASAGALGDYGYVSPAVHEDDGLDYLFEPQEEEEYDLPPGTALPSTPLHPTLTRAQRARIGVRLNRRQPSEQDYAHFALYQTNQKAYEATFLKQFVNHALHPAQIEECIQGSAGDYANVQRYIASVSANINGITNKMIWNAHCRVINLLTNAGKDGAPLWDTSSFDRNLFADFGPNATGLVAHKMNESWHRTSPNPITVRYTTKDYPLGHRSSPIEEIDEVADTLFSWETFGNSLPAGRAVKQPKNRKGKGLGLPGASVRDPAPKSHRDNWLASLVAPVAAQEHHSPPPEEAVPDSTAEDLSAAAGPRILSDLHLQDLGHNNVSPQPPPAEGLQPNIDFSPAGLTRLEQLFEEFGADALSGNHHPNDITPSQWQVRQVPTWPIRLLNDHKQRLTQESPQIFRRALPGIRAVIAEALSQGYYPVDPDLEELLVDIESRERSEEMPMQPPEEASLAQSDRQMDTKKPKESDHDKKRKKDQPAAIRMFNKPIEPSKKKRRINATNLSIAGLSQSTEKPTSSRKQKTSIAGSSNPELKQPKPKPTKQKASQHATAPPISLTPLPPHPSGSMTLESHQQLPPGAYFEPKSPSEKLVWRCSIKHAMGHYYNAGDRKNCPGCFTALSDNINAKVMDFYLPSRTHFHQPNPTSRWRPSKPFGRARRSAHLSHNSIAKEAYWSAISSGSTSDDALQIAVDAVTESLKPKVRKEPTPEPTPSPPPDLGPHPSGSETMEHSQDLPACAYFSKRERHEQFAWRCDINHALGRYYLAGDKRTCPGCGSNKNGLGKHMEMDFFMPPGVVVRQEVESVKWKARKPYKMREGKAKGPDKSVAPTHNQLASRRYWEAIDAGRTPDEAFKFAIKETDKWLDEKEEEVARRIERRIKTEKVKRVSQAQPPPEELNPSDEDTSAGYTCSYDKRANLNDISDEDMEDVDEYQSGYGSEGDGPIEQIVETSSDDESSSGSDSE